MVLNSLSTLAKDNNNFNNLLTSKSNSKSKILFLSSQNFKSTDKNNNNKFFSARSYNKKNIQNKIFNCMENAKNKLPNLKYNLKNFKNYSFSSSSRNLNKKNYKIKFDDKYFIDNKMNILKNNINKIPKSKSSKDYVPMGLLFDSNYKKI